MDRTESLEFLERWLRLQLYLYGHQPPFSGMFGIGIVPEEDVFPGIPAEIPVPWSFEEEVKSRKAREVKPDKMVRPAA